MLAEKQDFEKKIVVLFCQIESTKHIKRLCVLGVYRHIISITYRIDKYYEKMSPRYFTANCYGVCTLYIITKVFNSFYVNN